MRWSCLVLLLVTSAGCVSPSAAFGKRAAALGLIATIVPGDQFDVLVLRRPGPTGRRVHVYLEGDGTPWLGGLPTPDPTPRRPVAMELMARDPAPSIYVGRPCYHGLLRATTCGPALWTSERYSETVVSSMATAAQRIVEANGLEEVVWFGYSGGGTLAMLLAGRVPQSVAVVTVAANLDIDAWTDMHQDRRLIGSLNPARQAPLPDRIVQIHYAGGRDHLVPVDVVRLGINGPGRLVVVPQFDHVCCWQEAWPAILDEVNLRMPLPQSGTAAGGP